MISKKLALQVLNDSLSTGADYSEIYFQETINHGLSLENGKVETTTSNINTGAGIRLLQKNRSVYGYTNDLSKKGLLQLANSLKLSFEGKRLLTVNELKPIKYKHRHKIDKLYKDLPIQNKIELLKSGSEEIKKMNDPRIARYIASFNDTTERVVVFNSKGKWFKRDSSFGRIVFVVYAKDENGLEVGFEGPGTQKDISFFMSDINAKEEAKKAVKSALTLLTAKECPSGKMPVVIGNGWGGVLFHEACGHALEASSVAKGLSCFCNKLGEKVASPIVTAIDDSTIPYAWGSVDIDDEGILGEKRILIKNGILTNYLIDEFNGRRMNKTGNGCSRRQSYAYCPTSRMSNTYIANGKSTPEEIIKATKLGLYAVSFNGGSVNPVTGEFNFACSEAYIIRDGKICEPVKGASLIGKGYEILHNIDMVGNDLAFGTGICGASSGSIRTTVGQPTIRIQNITVGGRGGELK